MAIVVIGGHSRNIGKTGVVCSLISAMPERRWTAIKITQCKHEAGSTNGEPCECEIIGQAIAISEEGDPTTGTDSSRYLAAGAVRSLWVRTLQDQLAEAMPRIRDIIASEENVIIESNSILRYLKPDVYASVLDPQVSDFKASALRYLDRADAVLLSGNAARGVGWAEVYLRLIERIPKFQIASPAYDSADFANFVAQRIGQLDEKFPAPSWPII
jgi:molybdopterin-guanine dinucleotide biosynthesis protein